MTPAGAPGLQHGGTVLKTGWAVVHKGEEYSGKGKSLRQPLSINFDFRGATVPNSEDVVRKTSNALRQYFDAGGSLTDLHVRQ
jgi:hypothetical protein